MRWLALLALAGLACGQDLASRLASSSPNDIKYVGWEVAIQPGHGTVCGWNHNFRQNQLLLDGPRRLRILFKVDHGKVEKMQLATEDCAIDPGTQTVVMLPGVTPVASIEYLASRGDDSSILAISMHADPAATPKLIALARDASDPKRQKKAFFWLSRSPDPAAGKFIERILR